ncbi:MAG: dTMP kinase, partial [Candidatus Marinimicrobia bacterium]|nr:dTMP kinase [Candidatus Neomarinimicrobiota bacterium]
TDRIEGEGIKFQVRVRKTYHDLAEKFQDRYVLLDGHSNIDHIQEKLLNEMKRRGIIS